MTLDYSLVIPAYNEETMLPATLTRARQVMASVTEYQGELIVTDNDSTDRTAEIARAHGARVVHEPHRQISRARNAGAAHSQARFLVFLDADSLLSETLLRSALDALASGRYCGGGALPVFDEQPHLLARGLLFTWQTLSRTLGWAAGSFVFCLREAFVETGGFPEQFYASEEIHFSRALRCWGRRRRMRMRILREGLVTSYRKGRWYSARQMLWGGLLLAIFPKRLQSREGCRFWYERPQEPTNS